MERGSIKVFADGLPHKWFTFIDENLAGTEVGNISPEDAMILASTLATDSFLTIEIWAGEAWRIREIMRAERRRADQAEELVEKWEWVARELADRGASCGFTLDDAFIEYAAREPKRAAP